MGAALAYSVPEPPRAEGPVLLTMPPRPPAGRDPSRGHGVEPGEFSAKDVFKALRYHSVMFLFLGTIAAAIGAAAGWTLFPARYTTYALLRVESSVPSLLETNGANRNEFGIYQATQAGLIKSHKIINRAVRKPEVLNLPMLQGLDDPIAFLEEKVMLEFSEKSELLKVTMTGEDPTQITRIVNGVVEAFITEVETYKQDKQLKYDRLLRAKSEQEKLLDDMQKNYYAQFRAPASNEAKTRTRQTKMLRYMQLLQDESRVKSDLNRSRELLASAQVRHGQIKQFEEPEQPVAAMTTAMTKEFVATQQVENDPQVQRKLADITRLEAYLANYKLNAPNPESDHAKEYERRIARERGDLELLKKQVVQLQQQQWQVQQQNQQSQPTNVLVKRSVVSPAWNDSQAVVLKLQGDVERFTIDQKHIEDELRGFAELLAEEPPPGQPPEQVLAEIKLRTAQEMVSRLEHETKKQKAELEADDRVKLIERANVPQNREMKKQLAFTGVGGLAGLALVGGLITATELRRKRVYGPTDAIFHAVPLVGRIPEHGFVRPASGSEPAADDRSGRAFREAIERVKTLVLRHMTKSKMQTLLVTSPVADEGKSILAWNLAAGFARTDYRVLFIDANLHAPTIHEQLNMTMPIGLAELLRGDRTLPEVVLRTPVHNLFCLAAGGVDDEAHRALDKAQFQRLLDRAKKEFDLVVIDSCALSESVDPLYIAQRVDAAILSLRTYHSSANLIEQAHQRLKLLGTPVLGAVLTDPTLDSLEV